MLQRSRDSLVRLPEVPSVSVRGLRVLLDDGSDMRISVIVNMRDTTRGACRLNSSQALLEHFFALLCLSFHSRVLFVDDNDMSISIGVHENMRDTTHDGRQLKGYGFIAYLASGSTIRRYFFIFTTVWVAIGLMRG